MRRPPTRSTPLTAHPPRLSRHPLRRVLLIYLMLMAVVAVLVILAGRQVYVLARERAVDQVRSRQELIAAQAARGVEVYYQSILSDMHFLRPADEMDLGLPQGAPLLGLLWRQLQGRASHLFFVDAKSLSYLTGATDGDSRVAALAVRNHENWLRSVKEPAVGPSQEIGGDYVTLLCVPDDPKDPQNLLVALVPVRRVKARLLGPVGLESAQTAMTVALVDDAGNLIASSDPAPAAGKANPPHDFQAAALAKDCMSRGHRISDVMPASQLPRGAEEPSIGPRIVTAEPVRLAGKTWALVAYSPLAEINEEVDQALRYTFIVSAFVLLTVGAVIASTARTLAVTLLQIERVQRETMARELERAREIQLSWLPGDEAVGASAAGPSGSSGPGTAGVARASLGRGIDIAAVNQPASHVSGDLYDWFALADGRIVVTIGDVTGHGMSAAFLMASVQLLVRETMLRVTDPGRCLEEVNRRLCARAFNGQFATLLVVVLDPERRELRLASAGHFPPLLGTGGEFRSLPARSGFVLGMEPDEPYTSERFEMPDAACMVLYTDGVVDAENAAGEPLDVEGLRRCLTACDREAKAIVEEVAAAVRRFRGDAELADDVTVVAVQLRPRRAAEDITPDLPEDVADEARASIGAGEG